MISSTYKAKRIKRTKIYLTTTSLFFYYHHHATTFKTAVHRVAYCGYSHANSSAHRTANNDASSLLTPTLNFSVPTKMNWLFASLTTHPTPTLLCVQSDPSTFNFEPIILWRRDHLTKSTIGLLSYLLQASKNSKVSSFALLHYLTHLISNFPQNPQDGVEIFFGILILGIFKPLIQQII